MKYRNLGVTLTRRCTAECKTCCFSCSPTCGERLDIDLLKHYIGSTKDNNDLQVISFTGGEPFLEFELMCELVAYVTQIGKQATCVTNCFWATSNEKATDLLTTLKKCGLRRINISFDRWHLEYVSAANIDRAIAACRKLHIPVHIGAVCVKGEKFGEIIDLLQEASRGIIVQTTPCLPVGSAKDNVDDSLYIRNDLDDNMPCLYDGYLAIAYDGEIYPCCSQMVPSTNMSVGNYKYIDFNETLKRIKNNGILYLLRNKGVDFFIPEALRLGLSFPSAVVSPCELCACFFNEDNISSFLPFVKATLKSYA